MQAGSYRPANEAGKVVIETDARFLFYPQVLQKLVFLQREFTRLGKSREQLPQLLFPEADGTVAAL